MHKTVLCLSQACISMINKKIKKYQNLEKEINDLVDESRNKFFWAPDALEACKLWDVVNKRRVPTTHEKETHLHDSEMVHDQTDDMGITDEGNQTAGDRHEVTLTNVDAAVMDIGPNEHEADVAVTDKGIPVETNKEREEEGKNDEDGENTDYVKIISTLSILQPQNPKEKEESRG